MITADDKVLNEDLHSRLHHKHAVVVQDLTTHWIKNYPWKKQIRSRDDVKSSKILTLWNLWKLAKSWFGIMKEMELQNEMYDEWKKALQSGLQESCWAEAKWSVIALWDVQDPQADGQTHYERRFNSPFDGPIVQFGAEVKLYPFSTKESRSSASARHKSLCWNIHWIRLERGWEAGLVIFW